MLPFWSWLFSSKHSSIRSIEWGNAELMDSFVYLMEIKACCTFIRLPLGGEILVMLLSEGFVCFSVCILCSWWLVWWRIIVFGVSLFLPFGPFFWLCTSTKPPGAYMWHQTQHCTQAWMSYFCLFLVLASLPRPASVGRSVTLSDLSQDWARRKQGDRQRDTQHCMWCHPLEAVLCIDKCIETFLVKELRSRILLR